MEIRMSEASQQLARRLDCAPVVTDLLACYRNRPAWPWRECWLEFTLGLAVFHFRHASDLRGEWQRVPVGLGLLRTLERSSLQSFADTLLKWAAGDRPARPLATLPDLPASRYPKGTVPTEVILG